MRSLCYLLLVLMGYQNLQAQEFFVKNDASQLSVSGTSSLHDWECTVEHFKGNVTATIADGQVKEISAFDFEFDARQLKSGKSGMDKKVYDALEEEKHPKITFKGTKVVLNENGTATFTGNMNVAGTTRELSTSVTVEYSNGSLKLKGQKPVKLTDFNIEPPTAIFGTIKTGNDVNLNYTIHLIK